MGRPKGSIALKAGDEWSKKWPGYIHLANGTFRRPIKWRGKCTNVYFVETTCSNCGKSMLRRVKHAKTRYRAVCSIECKSKQIERDHHGNRSLKTIGPDQGSYVLVRNRSHHRSTGGNVREHILVAEKMIGRPIKRGEHVHHVDFIKSNNTETNLFVCATQAAHNRAHRSLNNCVPGLLRSGALMFDRLKGIYRVVDKD